MRLMVAKIDTSTAIPSYHVRIIVYVQIEQREGGLRVATWLSNKEQLTTPEYAHPVAADMAAKAVDSALAMAGISLARFQRIVEE